MRGWVNGSVGSLIQRGNVLSARVEGSEADPYESVFTLTKNDFSMRLRMLN